MFALHVERVRPDMDVAPAQHLWDETVTRQIENIEELAPPPGPVEQRGERAHAYVRALVDGPARRPVALEALQIATRAGVRSALVPLGRSALLTGGTLSSPDALRPALRSLDTAYRSRFLGLLPKSMRDRVLWSRVYGEVGAVAIGTPAFLDALRVLDRAATLAPERAVAWTNLGVALESVGELDKAVSATRQALCVDPDRPTPWVNLGRLQVRRGDLEGARSVLDAARQAGIQDPRLTALAKELQKELQQAPPNARAPVPKAP
jgi:tetratricopeptide (TPR) repeat protein